MQTPKELHKKENIKDNYCDVFIRKVKSKDFSFFNVTILLSARRRHTNILFVLKRCKLFFLRWLNMCIITLYIVFEITIFRKVQLYFESFLLKEVNITFPSAFKYRIWLIQIQLIYTLADFSNLESC